MNNNISKSFICKIIPIIERMNFSEKHLFHIDVCLLVIDNFECEIDDDNNPRIAIDAIKKFANKEITQEELNKCAQASFVSARNVRDLRDCSSANKAAKWAASAICSAARLVTCGGETWYSSDSMIDNAISSMRYKTQLSRLFDNNTDECENEIVELYIKHFGEIE